MCPTDALCPIRKSEFRADAGNVMFDRPFAQDTFVRDLAAEHALCNEARHFTSALGQGVHTWIGLTLSRQTRPPRFR